MRVTNLAVAHDYNLERLLDWKDDRFYEFRRLLGALLGILP